MRAPFTICLLLIAGFAWSQITITHSDFANAFAPGRTYKTYATPMGTPMSVFVGTASAIAQVWDFSTYANSHVGNNIVIDPATAPFYSQFPKTNVCIRATVFMEAGDTSHNWQYQRLDADHFYMYGVSDETAILQEYEPGAIQSVVPQYYGATWTISRDSTYLGANMYIISENSVAVDAFGTLKIPGGNYDCLRQTITRTSIVHSPAGVDTSRSRGYHYYAKNLAELHITGVPESQFNESTINVNAFSFSIPSGIGGAGDPNKTANVFALYPNSPNPFSSFTVVSYAVPAQGMVTVKVCDQMGRVVRTLVNQHQSAGVHQVTLNADGLKNGVYFCEARSGNFIQRQKMVLAK